MKVSLRWLESFLDLPTTDHEEIATVLANIGHEVEGFEVLEPQFRGVKVGRVLSVEPHPNADKIRVCEVTTGGPPAQIICGAWNFEAGAVVPVAEPGAVLGEDFQITQREIRGVTSNGMICSARELGLGEDAEGILVLAEDLPIGADFSELVELPDVVFDLAITPNRPDAMSMLGVAHDLGAYWDIPVRQPEIEFEEAPEDIALQVRIDDPDRCRRFVARQVAGVTIGPSPLWMQQRLAKAGVRSISNVVDVSNYVMMELGQPTHAFDFDKVSGAQIIVRAARDGEKLTTLDDVERMLSPQDLVVADAEAASSLAGTMGGAESEVSPHTENVLVEAASWDPATILRMSRRHGLRSEASARFERNVDPNLPPVAADRVAQLIVEVAGGRILAGSCDVYPRVIDPVVIELDVALVDRILGIPFPEDGVAALLRRLGMQVAGSAPLAVTVPTNRPDLSRPIDLVEEVARLHGLDNFPSTLPSGRAGGLTVAQRRLRRLRSILQGGGFSEAMTFSFHGHAELSMLDLPDGDARRDVIEVKNPLREEESLLRTTLLPGLLKALRYNVGHGNPSVALYEIGKVFFPSDAAEFGVVPHQPDQVGFAAIGSLGLGAMDAQARPVDVFTGTALWRLVCDQMGLGPADVAQTPIAALHPGRSAEVRLDGSPVGFVGELHPAVARAFGLEGRVVVGEFDVEQIVAERPAWEFSEPSVFPRTEFDLAFEYPVDEPAARLIEVTSASAGSLLESAAVFDEFSGGTLGAGRRSLAIRYSLRAADRTLTGKDVTEIRQEMIQAAGDIGAVLRGAPA